MTTYTIDGITTGTGSHPGTSAHEAWRDWCSMVHGEFRVDFPEDSYRGRVRRQRTETFELVSWLGESEYVRRESRGIRRDPRGHYELVMPVQKRLHVGPEGADHALVPGEMALLPIDTPFHLAHDDGLQGLMLLIPFQRIDDRLGTAGHRVHHIVADKGLARVTRDLLLSLVRERDHLTGEEFDAAVDRAVDLVCLAVTGEQPTSSRSGDAAVLGAVRRYVREHATDIDFAVQTMAAAIGWSPRYIQSVLARAGLTATELARTERLELARLRLASPAFDHHSISDVAASVGFQSPSAFTAAFRRHFGATPREVRSQPRSE
ncbi:helix-turn-helix transcriptional regulator [Nocardioides daeguensis]|uniref:Helix-turn-helix domain-containing protein n=1 Tax=Nocardioides daeguensis TaxID=908359 RepID=A0ABP6V7Q5_9ACTN|nr:AraC family transcriptional regulator [Nocardioides daeguensis]MBV6726483.1 AraC family transcriptional regulator [Nocardioides daeguensis]MCR1772326.1 AraC family transcriptional regulator [Nocardioides daeguensis]